jgi:hypothetical protein
MKIHKQIGLTGLTTLLSLVMTAGNVGATACHDTQTNKPNQAPTCSNWEGDDNGCTQITYSPAWPISTSQKNSTGQTHSGDETTTIRVTVTTTTYQCYYVPLGPAWCSSEITSGPTTSTTDVHPPHFIPCT